MTETEKEILGCNSMKAAILKGARLGGFEAEYVKAIVGEEEEEDDD